MSCIVRLRGGDAAYDSTPLRRVAKQTTAFAQIAQSVEQGIENPRVGGSIPSLGTTIVAHFISLHMLSGHAGIFPGP